MMSFCGKGSILKNGMPTISVVLPVLNEARKINETIAHLRGLSPPGPLEIIVVDGDPIGGTIRTVQDKRVLTAVAETGRGRQMNHGASLASGDILLFLHADTLLPADALTRVSSALENGHTVGGAFDLGIRTEKRIFRITEQYVALRTRLTRVPFGDQAIFIRKHYFDEIGGFREIPVMEDVELMRRIKKRGDQIVIVAEKVMTSARRWESEGIFYGTIRNLILQLAYVLGVPPDRLVPWYKS